MEVIMRTRELLEKDKERLYARLVKADTPDQTVQALEEELSRIQIQYGELEPDETLSREASYSLQTARAALSLVDSTGEIRTYDRTDRTQKAPKGKYIIPLAGGMGLGVVGALLLTSAPDAFVTLGGILLAAALCLTAVGGYNFGRRKNIPTQSEQYIDVRMDNDKIYRNLGAVLTVIDHNLEDAKLSGQAEQSDAPSAGDLPDEELKLLSSLLETAYASLDTDESRQSVSDIKFYLHKRSIEVVDYSDETNMYFNRMPASRTCTLKPAIVKNKVALIRGMAAVKSR